MMRTSNLDANEARIQIEQIRLLLGNLGSSAIPGILVAMLLVYALHDGSNLLPLCVWCAAVTLSKLIDVFDAKRLLASTLQTHQLRALKIRLMVLHGIDGAVWGALAWVAVSPTSTAGTILVFAVLSGVVGNSMSILSPVLPAFVMFCVFELGTIALKVWQFQDIAFISLGIACLLYVVTLLVQASNSCKASRTAIALRFENIDLIERLQRESEKSHAALLKAEEANIAKSRFLAAASHDLRQPIHAQGLFLEVLSRTGLNPIQRDLISSIRSASDASAEMLHTLLDYSRIEAGVIVPQVRTFMLQPLLNKIENELAPQANAAGIVYRSRETAIAVRSDPALIELILRNLVSNAIRYTKNGGVLVACRLRDGKALLEVWDTGIGIAPFQQQEIFREFHQLGNPERDRQKGLGLGLSIVRGLVNILGHELSLLSRPRRGSVFRLEMPVDTATLREPEAVILPRELHINLPDVHVLLIEDDAIVRVGMVQLLNDWGCRCIAADSLDEALTLLQGKAPDLVISDYRLREQRTGTQAIETLRAIFGANLPALLITGDTAPVRLREARTSGLPLLHKPVAPLQLRTMLIRILSEHART